MRTKQFRIIGIVIILVLTVSFLRGMLHLHHCKACSKVRSCRQIDHCGQLTPMDVLIYFLPFVDWFLPHYNYKDFKMDIYAPSTGKTIIVDPSTGNIAGKKPGTH